MDTLMGADALFVAAAALTLSAVAVFTTITVAIRQNSLLKRYRILLNGDSQLNLESLLMKQGNTLESARKEIDQLANQVQQLASDSRHHAQRIAIVRFNAFPDTGSDLSFSIALLDANGNGFVISSLYGRNESRVYAKPIQAGTSTYAISSEEQAAINRAMVQNSPN